MNTAHVVILDASGAEWVGHWLNLRVEVEPDEPDLSSFESAVASAARKQANLITLSAADKALLRALPSSIPLDVTWGDGGLMYLGATQEQLDESIAALVRMLFGVGAMGYDPEPVVNLVHKITLHVKITLHAKETDEEATA